MMIIMLLRDDDKEDDEVGGVNNWLGFGNNNFKKHGSK